MKHRNTRLFAVAAALSLTFLARTAIAQKNVGRNSQDDDISTCLSTASSDYSSCADGEAWYVVALCAAQRAEAELDCYALSGSEEMD